MFDINTIFAQALAAAVEQATAPLIARIAGLETSITALENNPAIGVDTTLAARVTALETIKSEQADYMAGLCDRIAALELQQGSDSNNSVFDANDLKTLKDRIEELESETRGDNRYLNREDVDSLIEEALDNHNSDYDHDDFLTKDELNSELHDQINDTLSNATISISV